MEKNSNLGEERDSLQIQKTGQENPALSKEEVSFFPQKDGGGMCLQ